MTVCRYSRFYCESNVGMSYTIMNHYGREIRMISSVQLQEVFEHDERKVMKFCSYICCVHEIFHMR